MTRGILDLHHNSHSDINTYILPWIRLIDQATQSKTKTKSKQSKMTSLSDKLKKLFHLHALRDRWATWAPLMPAKSHLSAEYNFPGGRWAGQGSER